MSANKKGTEDQQDKSSKETEEQKLPQKEEEEPISLGGNQRKKKKVNSFYDPPLQKPDEKFDPEVKRQSELVRRWKVHIFQIEVVNLQGAAIDPFLQVIIGGNFFIEIKKTSGGFTHYVYQGEMGITYQTEVLTLVEPNDSGRFFTTEIVTEYRASYFELLQQRVHLELWTRGGSSGMFLNQFIGYASIPLIEIANGNFKQSVVLFPVGEEIAITEQAKISFNMYLEEIWDFYLTFMDWKTTSLEKEKDKTLTTNPQVEIKLISPQALQNTSVSEVAKNTKLPHWALFEEGIKYRGTYTDLKQEKLLINLWNSQLLGKTLIGQKTVPLKHCLDLNFLKAEMVIHKPRRRTEQNIREKAQTCGIQGTLRVGQRPKYAQTGDVDVIAKNEQYLAVQVQRLAVFDSLDEAGGEVTVFATVDWSGAQKRTRGIRRPNLNETLLFHLPIEEDLRKDPARMAEYINDELETKSEITVNVWADTGKATLENLGSAKVCLQQLHYQKFEDKMYTDERTKQKISFQCRVFTTTLKLHSAFFDTSNSSVSLSLWFQPEVPYPQVDLGRLRPKEEDSYPSQEIEQSLKNGTFQSRFNQILQRNFPPEYPTDERRFDCLFFSDQYKQKHLLPLFLSKITPPDSNLVKFVENEGLETEIGEDVIAGKSKGASLTPSRGIRTLSEVAHFVRCLPFRGNQEYQRENVWSSPDFVLTMRMGSIEEHTLLLASMFRAVKYENIQDVLNIGKSKKQASSNKLMDESDEVSGMDNRVFVCLGRARDTGAEHSWVMTINRTYDEVTMWEASMPRKWSLPGRISEEEVVKLQGYLSPNLSESEKKQIAERRELKRQESSWYLQSELHQSEMEFDQQPRPSLKAANHQGSYNLGEMTDDEKDSDTDFLANLDKLVYYEDLDQKYKGANINDIGKIKGLSRERQEHLKDLDYYSDEGGQHQQNSKPKTNKFLEQQDQERMQREKQRLDKHLLPIDSFYDWSKTAKTYPSLQLPYASVDLIFNQRNVWANLQNQNPGSILYHLHDERQWLPLISDPGIPHSLLIEKAEGEQKKQRKPDEVMDYRMRGDYMKAFVSFYDPKGMEMPFSVQQVSRYENLILKEVETAIKQVRSSKNLGTKLRKSPAASAVLRLQLDLLEDIECERIPNELEESRKSQVERELLKLVPESYRLALLPAFFNYCDAERIRTVIVDQAQDFILNKKHMQTGGNGSAQSQPGKKVMFAVGVRIYAYHNQINSVRLALARMSPVENLEKPETAPQELITKKTNK